MPAKRPAHARRLGRPPGPFARHRDVADALRRRMKAGDWKCLEVLPSLRALARSTQSSVSAVRLALDLLAAEGQIAANPRGRWVVARDRFLMASGRGPLLLVFSHPMENTAPGSYWMELQRGVVTAAGRMQVPLLMLHDHALQDGQPRGFLDLPLCGVALAGRFGAANLRAYERLPLPVSYLDTPSEGYDLHSASADNEAIGYDATRRMLALGHRRIACVRFVLLTLREIDPDARERQAGFVRAMREAGLDAGSVFNHIPGKSPQHSIMAMLRKRPAYTAVFCVGVTTAQTVASVAQAEGVDIPRDLSLCCVQGQGNREPFSGPVLDFHEIALRGALLLDRPKRPAVRERLPAAWRDRGSLTPPRGA
ncbi:MAG: substrate-binding domain-containing protein [Planctomycetota bacterium]|nr:substrate-binding domain-containing protein [Planctomycetota bacterium]